MEDNELRIAVITKGIATTHTSTVGGGDVFNVFLIRALKELKHEVVLCTTHTTRWDIINQDLGWSYVPDSELIRQPSHWRDRGKSFTQFVPPSEIRMLKRTCDITFNSYGDNLFWNTDLCSMLSPLTKEQLTAKYSTASSKFYLAMYKFIFQRMKFLLRTLILTDSHYAKRIIEETIGAYSKVLYPPVNCELFKQALAKEHRQNNVVTVGRLTWEKNFGIIPEIANRVKSAVFHIVGSIVSEESLQLIRYIKRRSIELNLGHRIKIHLDPSTKERLNIMEKCKVYINCWKGEYFGIAVAEALSAGLAPVVPNDGGQVEIVPSPEHIYRDIDEAASRTEEWLSNWSPTRAFHLSQKAEKFSHDNFRRNLSDLLTNLAVHKNDGKLISDDH
jgi:glycosyltransferase involved in cell wall biosynthesis